MRGRTVDPMGDHRIQMAATVAGLVAEGTTTITQGDCHIISYPRFVDDLRALGADVGGTS